MIKSCSATATLVLSLALSQAGPAQASAIHRHHAVKALSGRMGPASPAGVRMPVLSPLDPSALNADRAIMWQDSLHGEVN